MITLQQYFGLKARDERQVSEAVNLLDRVDRLTDEAEAAGIFARPIDPDTETEISGSRGGNGDGGFRLPDAVTGRSKSSHKEARGVDVYDPGNHFDNWLTTYDDGLGGNSKLEEYGLYREHPDSTNSWVHLTTRPPGSGKRTFQP